MSFSSEDRSPIFRRTFARPDDLRAMIGLLVAERSPNRVTDTKAWFRKQVAS